MPPLPFDPIAAFYFVLRLLAFGLPTTMFLLNLLAEKTRDNLLSFDHDGWRMIIFGLAFIGMSVFSPFNSMINSILGSTVAFWLPLGILIALPDHMTKRLFTSWTWALYLILGGFAYFYGAGYGSLGFSSTPNFYGFQAMLVPEGVFVLLVNLTYFASVMTPKAQESILPQDLMGLRLMLPAAVLALLALFNINGVAMIILMGFSMNAFAYGLIIALPHGVTEFLMNRWMAILYVVGAGVILFGLI